MKKREKAEDEGKAKKARSQWGPTKRTESRKHNTLRQDPTDPAHRETNNEQCWCQGQNLALRRKDGVIGKHVGYDDGQTAQTQAINISPPEIASCRENAPDGEDTPAPVQPSLNRTHLRKQET